VTQPPSFVERGGQRIPLAGVSSCEPLLRGCDQRAWLAELARMGIRHLVVALNGAAEDSCLFARRHPEHAAAADAPEAALYDLDRRDEGVFARLQFLFEAAASLDMLVGLSLFDVSPCAPAGPLRRESNIQGLSLAELADASAVRAADLRQRLLASADWIGAELRGRQTVWVEIFRGGDDLLAQPDGVRNALGQLENDLARRLATALAKPAKDGPVAPCGPWVAAPLGFDWQGCDQAYRAPFTVRHGAAPESDHPVPAVARAPSTATLARALEPQAALYHFALPAGAKRRTALTRNALWHTVLRGFWPVVPGGLSERAAQRSWADVAQMARFALQWAARSRLRPAPEVLAPMPARERLTDHVAAATDGAGRYVVYFGDTPENGVRLATLPGSYRWYWIDPRSLGVVDRGDGIDGGPHCGVPGPVTLKEALLVLDQQELPDPLSTW
jgi:hypothetical protein